jgi:hypothetical protein
VLAAQSRPARQALPQVRAASPSAIETMTTAVAGPTLPPKWIL